jgi:flavin reductase (DIM6/NTAB) family NADH-FMN oxidoreductase RutF
MTKRDVRPSNDYCPQTLFMYGTYGEDGTPDLGLFCWFSYCWDTELGVMACIGGRKQTKDRILATGVFSANLVTEELLPLADYCGHKSGYDADKIPSTVQMARGSVLNVPILTRSPWSYELEVFRRMPLDDSDVFLCKIRNIVANEELFDESRSVEERLRLIKPISTTCQTYLSYEGSDIGKWGAPLERRSQI